MFPERHESLLPQECRPNRINGILGRFGTEYIREQETLNITDLEKVVLQGFGEKFDLEHSPSKCPFYKYVFSESLLVGLSNPTDIERLEKVLCGHTVTYKDILGFMSGERGNKYEPKSQCWRLTIELAWLIKFMKQNEDLPSITAADDEETLREILDERNRIQKENTSRQMVFSTWQELKPKIQSLLTEQSGQPTLPLPQKTNSGFTSFAIVKTHSLDILSQLNVGSPEYQELTRWVEQTVLNPMLKLIGEENTALHLTDEGYLFTEDTARNCPQKPAIGFDGMLSLINP